MSVTEAMIACALVAILGGLGVAAVSSTEKPRVQEEAAARFLVMQIRQARQEALQRSTTVGIRFETEGKRVRFRPYADGNGNGLRTRDIEDGIDTPIAAARGLEDDFAGTGFGVVATLPPIDAGGDGLQPGDDPIRVGTSHMVSFGPTGRGSSGTVYVRGSAGGGGGSASGGGGRQFAVRVFGQTGRVRLLEFRASDQQWIER